VVYASLCESKAGRFFAFAYVLNVQYLILCRIGPDAIHSVRRHAARLKKRRARNSEYSFTFSFFAKTTQNMETKKEKTEQLQKITLKQIKEECMTLEESKRHLIKMIRHHFHQYSHKKRNPQQHYGCRFRFLFIQ
jgi:hypothetical protein